MRDDDRRASIYRVGRDALTRLKQTRDFHDWIAVGNALVEARNEALGEIGMTGSNLPASMRLGGSYTKAFSAILKREELEIVDRTTRNQLFEIITKLPAIEAHRALFAPAQQAKLNHPSAVLRHYRRSSAAQNKRHARRGPSKLDQLREELMLAREETERQRERIGELEDETKAKSQEIERRDQRIAELEAALQAALDENKRLRREIDRLKLRRSTATHHHRSKPAKTSRRGGR